MRFRLDPVPALWQDGGPTDVPRKLLLDTLARRPDLDLKNLSLSIGQNHAYLQQYLMRGSPRELPDSVRRGLAALIGLTPEALRHSAGSGGDSEAQAAAPQRSDP